MPLHPRTLPAGFIAPCLPSSAPQAPSGGEGRHSGVLVLVERQERPGDVAPRMTGAREALFVPDDFLSNPMAAHLFPQLLA